MNLVVMLRELYSELDLLGRKVSFIELQIWLTPLITTLQSILRLSHTRILLS